MRVFLIIFGCFVAFNLIMMMIDSNRLVTRQYRIVSSKLRRRHRFVYLTDLHGKQFGKDDAKLVEKIRLWPSRSGVLHGIKSIRENGDTAEITTHCGEVFVVRNSRSSRAARWLRNKWCAARCKKCAIPDWKLAKYSSTMMTQKWGSGL